MEPDYPHHIITSTKPLPHGFSDLPTALIKEYKEHQWSREGKMCNFHPSSVKTKSLENCIANIYFLLNHYLFAPESCPLHFLLICTLQLHKWNFPLIDCQLSYRKPQINMVGNIWFLSPLVLSKWEDLAFSVLRKVCLFFNFWMIKCTIMLNKT